MLHSSPLAPATSTTPLIPPWTAVNLQAAVAVCARVVEELTTAARPAPGDPQSSLWRLAEAAVGLATGVAARCGVLEDGVGAEAVRLLSGVERWVATLPPNARVPRSLRRACDRAGMAVYIL
jgi:hypothetical protein